jgi:hypothetical protein
VVLNAKNMLAPAKNIKIFSLLSVGTVLIAINTILTNTSKQIKRNK